MNNISKKSKFLQILLTMIYKSSRPVGLDKKVN